MTDRVPVAMIGGGWVAEHGYVPVLPQSGLEVVAIYDPSEERARRLGDMLRVPPHARRLDACFDAPVRGVILCTPADLHVSHLEPALAAGKYVLCEKPVLRGAADVHRLEADHDQASAAERRLMGSATTRLRRDVRQLLSWVDAGRVGEIRRVSLGWWRAQGVPQPGSWRTDAARCPAGVLEDLGPHLLDVAASLVPDVPARPARVRTASLTCRSGTTRDAAGWFETAAYQPYTAPDFARAAFDTPSGVAIEIETCWTSDEPGDLARIHIEGTRGTATLEGLFGWSTLWRVSEPQCRLEIDGEPAEVRRFVPGPIGQIDGFATSLRIFAEWCQGRGEPVAGWNEIAQVALWIEAITTAARASDHAPAVATSIEPIVEPAIEQAREEGVCRTLPSR
jgi:predicted dehydrogenase